MQRGRGRGWGRGRGNWGNNAGGRGWQQQGGPAGVSPAVSAAAAAGGMMGGGMSHQGMMGNPMMQGAPGWTPEAMMAGPMNPMAAAAAAFAAGRGAAGMMGHWDGPGMGAGNMGPGPFAMNMGPGPGVGPGPIPGQAPGQRPGPAGPPRDFSGRMALPGPPAGPPAAPAAGNTAADDDNPSKRAKIANDYCQHYVDTGVRPQNFLMDALLSDRYEDYPVLKKLLTCKTEQVKRFNTPPYALRADLKRLQLSKEVFGTKFDVILIDPPWEEYKRRAPGTVTKDMEVWSWHEIRDLDIDAIADSPSFVFLWCGCEEGLEAGRHCLDRWGFRRIEDICWVKTNKDRERKYLAPDHQQAGSMLVHTKEHCLVGMRGKLTRNRDGQFVHANCDTDIIISEEMPVGSTKKPDDLYGIIERFCNGRRRLELFGEDHNVREGWVTVGKNLSHSNFRAQVYLEHFKNDNGVAYTEHRGMVPRVGAPILVPTTSEIEDSRPKSPTAGSQQGRSDSRGRGFGMRR